MTSLEWPELDDWKIFTLLRKKEAAKKVLFSKKKRGGAKKNSGGPKKGMAKKNSDEPKKGPGRPRKRPAEDSDDPGKEIADFIESLPKKRVTRSNRGGK